MKPHLFNQENKMRLINQALYKRRKIALKKLRIQQQNQPPPITINIKTGFETNQRIKEIYKKLELLTPQERTRIPERPPAPRPPSPEPEPPRTNPQQETDRMEQWVRSGSGGRFMVKLRGKSGRRRVRMDTEAGVNTNIVESVRKPDYV